jgi:hypothetical protein
LNIGTIIGKQILLQQAKPASLAPGTAKVQLTSQEEQEEQEQQRYSDIGVLHFMTPEPN